MPGSIYSSFPNDLNVGNRIKREKLVRNFEFYVEIILYYTICIHGNGTDNANSGTFHTNKEDNYIVVELLVQTPNLIYKN